MAFKSLTTPSIYAHTQLHFTSLSRYFSPSLNKLYFHESRLNGFISNSFFSLPFIDSPLDLSMSLVADIIPPISSPNTEDERKSISGDSYTSSGNSSSGDLMDATIQAPPKQRAPRGERNLLPCEICGKAFDRPSLLKRHTRVHTGKSLIHLN